MLERILASTHVFLYRISNGRIGGSVHHAPVLLMTTIGRKSGKKRTRPLLYSRDGNRLVVIASNGGRRVDPSWWTNLRHNPTAEVQMKRMKHTVYAKRASGTEKERLWRLMTNLYPPYDEYAKKTRRDIQVVLLVPKME
ncbi:MAG TPA: nitroreductase family deazaflavin-dependent oxidoreductase [Candidatus Binatus sp.]|nr:nitroreductase family deazaflavin-dependent oxidoreductase [Candidatus Binatus sp.]